MNRLILNNFKSISDDVILDVFSYVTVTDGFFYEGLYYGDRKLRDEEKIDSYIYQILAEIEK